MSAELIRLARWDGEAWLNLAGDPYSAPELPAGASFISYAKDGEQVIEMLIPGAISESCVSNYETRCQECGDYMQVRPPAGWKPKPVYVRCDGCIAKDGEQVDDAQTQRLIENFRKMMRGSR